MPSPLINILKNKKFPRAYPGYGYVEEKDTPIENPAYCRIENARQLPVNEKRIWVLRTDRILATGIKESDERGNLKSAHGHPSLALPEGTYDGSAFYAGWVAQRSDKIEVYLASGRLRNEELTKKEKAFERECVELYIAKQFINAYGQNNVVFVDYIPGHLENFLQDKSVPEAAVTRTYSPAYINRVDLFPKTVSKDVLARLRAETMIAPSSASRLSQVVPISQTDFSQLSARSGSGESKEDISSRSVSYSLTSARSKTTESTSCLAAFSRLFRTTPKPKPLQARQVLVAEKRLG